MDVGANIVLQGLVQGVGFRYFVMRHALRLGLNGFARNLDNGDVEIQIEGKRSLIEELLKELNVGPRSAHVAKMKVEWKDADRNCKGFEIR